MEDPFQMRGDRMLATSFLLLLPWGFTPGRVPTYFITVPVTQLEVRNPKLSSEDQQVAEDVESTNNQGHGTDLMFSS